MSFTSSLSYYMGHKSLMYQIRSKTSNAYANYSSNCFKTNCSIIKIKYIWNIISNVRLCRVNIFILDSHLNSVKIPIWDVITARPFSKTPPFKDMPANSTSANSNRHSDWQMESVSDYKVLAATLSLLCCLQSLRLSQRQVHIFLSSSWDILCVVFQKSKSLTAPLVLSVSSVFDGVSYPFRMLTMMGKHYYTNILNSLRAVTESTSDSHTELKVIIAFSDVRSFVYIRFVKRNSVSSLRVHMTACIGLC